MKDIISRIIKIILSIILGLIIIGSIFIFILYLRKPNLFKSRLLVLKGAMYSEKGKEGEAIEIYKRAENIDSDNPMVYDAIARSYARLERWDETIKYLKKGIEKAPKVESFYKVIFTSYMSRDLSKEAKEYFADLLNKNPENKLAAKYLRLTQGYKIFIDRQKERQKGENR